jgi:hypothetical protein
MPSESNQLRWVKARQSIPSGACVELARVGDNIALRDSKNPDVAPFLYTIDEMAAFLSGAKEGEFDHLVSR